MVLASTLLHPSNLEHACEKFSEKNRKFEWNRNIRWFLLLNEMLSYMILDMATMKIDLFWENEQLQSNYALDPTNGNYVGIELVTSGAYHKDIALPVDHSHNYLLHVMF